MEKIIEETVRIFSMSAIRYFILAGIPFALFYLLMPDKLSKFKIQKKLASKNDFIREVWHSMQSTLVFAVVGVAVLFTLLKQFTLIYDNVNDFPVWYIAASLLVALILQDTYFYWMHRLLHHKMLFKHAHLLHHKSTNPSPWTAYSFHIIEAIVEGLVLVPIVFILPIHEITILLFTVAGFIINVYGHLGYEIMPKWFRNSWLFEVFNTSVHHNLHHSKFKGNYGLYFRIWDRLMNTEHPDYLAEYDKLQAQRFGEPLHKKLNSTKQVA
ncbi:sterol desaturase family protein [Pedobacter lithocola]|uniref:Sterol desaturase family protein n=1 Tax=Pedobacter lithocola TaxID=1908239 RepID=A0ABV8P6K6_9SPHI